MVTKYPAPWGGDPLFDLGDFELALRHLLDDGTPLSKSSIARLTAQ